MLVHRFICFQLQTYCHYLFLSLCNFQIWFKLVTPPVTQQGEAKQGERERRQVLIGPVLQCWAEVVSGDKGSLWNWVDVRGWGASQNVEVTGSIPAKASEFFDKALILLCSVFESDSNSKNKCPHFCVWQLLFPYLLFHCDILSFHKCKSHEQELIQLVNAVIVW